MQVIERYELNLRKAEYNALIEAMDDKLANIPIDCDEDYSTVGIFYLAYQELIHATAQDAIQL